MFKFFKAAEKKQEEYEIMTQAHSKENKNLLSDITRASHLYNRAVREQEHSKKLRDNLARHNFYNCTEFVNADNVCDKHGDLKQWTPTLSVEEAEEKYSELYKKKEEDNG